MEGKFTVSFTDGFNYLHVHRVLMDSLQRNYTGGPGTDASSPATYYKAMPSVSLFYNGNYISFLHTL